MTIKMMARLICPSSSSISFSNQLRKRLLVERSISSAPANGAQAIRMMIWTMRVKLLIISSRMRIQSTRNMILEPILRSPTSWLGNESAARDSSRLLIPLKNSMISQLIEYVAWIKTIAKMKVSSSPFPSVASMRGPSTIMRPMRTVNRIVTRPDAIPLRAPHTVLTPGWS